MAGSLSAQTLTDVINEFNEGVAKVNNQEYDASLEHFNQVVTLAGVVGDSASDMKAKAEELIPASYYKQALLFLKRKQFDNAIPYLESTIEKAAEYSNNEESATKAKRYLMQSYMMEAQRNMKNESYDQSLDYFDKALEIGPKLYQAHYGKGMIFMGQDDIDPMLEEFKLAKEGALAKNDAKTVGNIDEAINAYYNKLIKEEYEAVDPEEADYSYVVEACENALNANPDNPRAYYYLALVSNKQIEYDAAIENALKGIPLETDPVWQSALYLELGHAYQNTAEYDKACETLKKVTEDPFLTSAERKLGNIPGCN